MAQVECLTPDFRGDLTAVAIVAQAGLDVYAMPRPVAIQRCNATGRCNMPRATSMTHWQANTHVTPHRRLRAGRALVDALLQRPARRYAHNVETVERLQPFVRDRRAGNAHRLVLG
jgi:lipoate synthase